MSLATPTATWFNDDHRLYAHSVSRFFADHLVPNIERWNEEEMVERNFWHKAGEAGILGALSRKLTAAPEEALPLMPSRPTSRLTAVTTAGDSAFRVLSSVTFRPTQQKNRKLAGCPNWRPATWWLHWR